MICITTAYDPIQTKRKAAIRTWRANEPAVQQHQNTHAADAQFRSPAPKTMQGLRGELARQRNLAQVNSAAYDPARHRAIAEAIARPGKPTSRDTCR